MEESNMRRNAHTYSQRGCWERGLCPVGGDCYHTILNPISKMKSWLFTLPNICAMAIAPYGFFNE